MKSSLGERGDLVQLALQRGWRGRLPPRLQKQFRRGEDALAHHAVGVAPSVVKFGGLARGPWLLGEGLRHPLTLLRVDARHRRQIAHGGLRGDLAFAHLPLYRFRQRFHQRQAARHPRGAAIKTPRQIVDRAAQLALHLRQQPALFERALRLAHAQRTVEHQRVGFAHRPHHGVHRVAAQLLERGDALMPVNDQVSAGVFDDDDGCLLARFSQRSEQAPMARRMADPEVLQAAVQLMKLQLRHGSRLGFQYAPAWNWSFVAKREVRRQALWDQ